MSEIKNFFDGLVNDLRKEREDLQRALQHDMEETRQDAQRLWAELEDKWDDFRAGNQKLQQRAAVAGEDLSEGLQRVADELQAGYRELRDTLKLAGKPAAKPRHTAKPHASDRSHPPG